MKLELLVECTYYLYNNTPCYSPKVLGYYSNIKNVQDAILFYSKLPGFCDTPNGFVVKERKISGWTPNADFYNAYILVHTEDFEDYDDMIELGLYCDNVSAQDAIRSFCANNSLFLSNSLLEIEQIVDRLTINKHYGWIEGFDVVETP